MKQRSYSAFPGRAAVLAELKRAGHWTPKDVAAWARCNGGSEPTYAALAWAVRRGKVAYTPNLWVWAV
jgi:hypothetical protein